MYQRQQQFYTVEEYLTLEETADYRSEYYQGEIFAMAGGSANHNRIAGNFLTALNVAFESDPNLTTLSPGSPGSGPPGIFLQNG